MKRRRQVRFDSPSLRQPSGGTGYLVYAFPLILVEVPGDIAEARRDLLHPIPVTETMTVLKPTSIAPIKETDREPDGAIVSARDAARRVIDTYHAKSLQTDLHGNAKYNPLQRAFYRKSSNKFVRMAGVCHAISYAIRLSSECINIVRFGDGLFLKETVDNEQMIWLAQFRDQIKVLVERDINRATKYGEDNRPVIVIEKSVVHAAAMMYDYVEKTIDQRFDVEPINSIAQSPADDESPITLASIIARFVASDAYRSVHCLTSVLNFVLFFVVRRSKRN